MYDILDSAMENRKGFTLIEVMIATIVIAIISVASFEFFMQSARLLRSPLTRLECVNAAREKTEEVYWELNPMPEAAVPITLPSGRAATQEVIVTDEGDYNVITVKITWVR